MPSSGSKADMDSNHETSDEVIAPFVEKEVHTTKQKQRHAKETKKCFNKLLTKTQLCVFHMQGTCHFGPDCTFAHSPAEMRQAPNFSKTELCPSGSQCADPMCRYAHNLSEMRIARKATPCAWHAVGACRNGARCPYSHDAKVGKQTSDGSNQQSSTLPVFDFMTQPIPPFNPYPSPGAFGGLPSYLDACPLPMETHFLMPFSQKWEPWQMDPVKLPLPGADMLDTASTVDTLGTLGSDSEDSQDGLSEKSGQQRKAEKTAQEIAALLEMKCNLEQELIRTLAFNNVQMDEMMDMNMSGYSSEAPGLDPPGLEAWLTA